MMKRGSGTGNGSSTDIDRAEIKITQPLRAGFGRGGYNAASSCGIYNHTSISGKVKPKNEAHINPPPELSP
ncbi:MAG: hypothetical protein LBP93_07675 [Treponema sp.]|jgi:hypothetical protein|nr:hypothetical protein [Treponema sp.]